MNIKNLIKGMIMTVYMLVDACVMDYSQNMIMIIMSGYIKFKGFKGF